MAEDLTWQLAAAARAAALGLDFSAHSVLLSDVPCLCLGAAGLRLHSLSTQQQSVWIGVDFNEGKSAHRRRFGGGELLAKAVGLKKGYFPVVLDATAGLGSDAFVLASLGCSMQLFERNLIPYALLQDGLLRGAQDAEIAPICARMLLQQGDARSVCLSVKPDVIYLDPMFPHRHKSAAVKKEMHAFQQWVGDDLDSASLLPWAQQHAQHRVVVKRPKQSVFLDDCPPAYQYIGKNTRFDVYLPKK